jgi:S1-C subfamily serine protease
MSQLQQADFEAKQNGKPLNPSSLSGALDNDLLLREEMTDEEYMNYRQALGKPTAFKVIEVLPNSLAAKAGIKPGDQVMRYGNKRVFDYRELEALALSEVSDGPAIVEVQRDGYTFTVTLPKGPTGLSTSNTMKATITSEIMNQVFPQR